MLGFINIDLATIFSSWTDWSSVISTELFKILYPIAGISIAIALLIYFFKFRYNNYFLGKYYGKPTSPKYRKWTPPKPETRNYFTSSNEKEKYYYSRSARF